MPTPSLSIVIPVYRGARTVGELVEALGETLLSDYALEVVLVDDASPDDSAAVCEALARSHPWVRFVALGRNVGEHNAVLAGLHHTSGEVVVVMDDDLQHPPEEVLTLVEALDADHDVVYGRYQRKRHGVFRNWGSQLNGWVATVVLDKPKGLYLSSFKAMRRFVVEQLCEVRDPAPYLDGYILRITQHVREVPVTHLARREGRSGYTLGKLVGLFLRQVIGFSMVPLRVASLLGLALSLVAMLAAVWFAVERMRDPSLPTGWASVIVASSLLGGVQLFALGTVGEYLGRLVHRLDGTPPFVVRRTVGFDTTTTGSDGLAAAKDRPASDARAAS
ncbi:MAG: glycosyltransferase family 2 protein [Sandaracinaceae bacterium]